MNNCKNCGNSLKEGVSFCNKCGNKVVITKYDQYDKEIIEEKTINKQVNEVKVRKNKTKLVTILLILSLFTCAAIIVAKDSIMYSYYSFRGDREEEVSQAVNYYSKALELKYDEEVVYKINNKIVSFEDFEALLASLKGIVKEIDLKNLYLDAYIYKAEENFINKNYETTWKYLDKAQEYNYDIEEFEYYYDLVKIKQEENEVDSVYIECDHYHKCETKQEHDNLIQEGSEDNAHETKVWHGTYEAGEYDRSVTITFLENETITFEFGPTEKTTHVPYGKYLMKVNSYNESSGELFLEGYEWVEKPETTWEFAKFNGFINKDEFKGEVYNTSKNHYLGTFYLNRIK